MGGGNPLKRLEKAGSKAGSQIVKGVESAAASVSDPKVWVAAMTGGMMGGAAMGAKEAEATYQAMSQAERDEANAEEARMAAAEEARLMEEQKSAQAEQARMTSEREQEADVRAKERARRLGTGRRGLLYQGKETGVTNTKLGG